MQSPLSALSVTTKLYSTSLYSIIAVLNNSTCSSCSFLTSIIKATVSNLPMNTNLSKCWRSMLGLYESTLSDGILDRLDLISNLYLSLSFRNFATFARWTHRRIRVEIEVNWELDAIPLSLLLVRWFLMMFDTSELLLHFLVSNKVWGGIWLIVTSSWFEAAWKVDFLHRSGTQLINHQRLSDHCWLV